MEFTIFSACIAFAFLVLFIYQLITKKLKEKIYPNPRLPPGSLGWPLIGETIGFVRAAHEGKPERFMRERMEKHDSRVFKTCLLGEKMIVFCGSAGNKLLFSNENKLVRTWWPSSVTKLFKTCLLMKAGDDAKRMRKIMSMSFLGPNALMKYVERVDMITQQHINTHWEGKEKVKVHPTVKLYMFELGCRLFASIEDPLHISKLASHFNNFLKGVVDFPIDFPGTTFYKAIRAANAIREELQLIANQRREVPLESKQDLLSHLLVTADPSGRFLSELEIVDNILLFLFSSYDTSSSAITMLIKYLGQMPSVFENVLKEQIGIAKSKEKGELLKWEDIQNMRHSWNVASEVMRLSPPALGAYREALVDFTYEGYTIPKGWKVLIHLNPSKIRNVASEVMTLSPSALGTYREALVDFTYKSYIIPKRWKLHWSTGLTHRDETLFPNPENFDASRFEGEGVAPYSYVPFGGGPRMCPGHEFARLGILVFLHNMIKRFKWDLLIPDEKYIYDPMLTPSQGLPVRLQPHQFSI